MLTQDFELALSDEATSKSFACSSTDPYDTNPVLRIDGLGIIGLPLSSRDAEAIRDKCHSRDEGTENPDASKANWTLDAKEFKLTNPSWASRGESYFASRAENLFNLLNFGCNIKPELVNLQLHCEGTTLLPQEDDRKDPKVFGKMIVSLPSEHEGGKYVLEHGGYNRVLETWKDSSINASWAAWYTGVSYSFQPITSGHRLVPPTISFTRVKTTMCRYHTCQMDQPVCWRCFRNGTIN